ncbi:hypothetical protein [Ensifer sp. BR816]|uniref:hypothetical protein n=1 Tax=Rhizobium sp. (strain BR816) TaxID=1057002 RepID=UPI000476224C|nr:hypothetical protein [Ensifer sp. BR816]
MCLGKEGRILLARCELQDRSQVAAQHDRQFVTIRHQFDPLDQATQHLCGARPCLRIAELVMKGRDLVVIILGEVRMQQGRRRFRRLEHRGQLLFPLFQSHHLLVDPLCRPALEDKLQ